MASTKERFKNKEERKKCWLTKIWRRTYLGFHHQVFVQRNDYFQQLDLSCQEWLSLKQRRATLLEPKPISVYHPCSSSATTRVRRINIYIYIHTQWWRTDFSSGKDLKKRLKVKLMWKIIISLLIMIKLRVCLIKWILWRMKKKKKKEEGKLFGGYLVGRERRKGDEPEYFLFRSTRKFSPQNGRKLLGRVWFIY